MVVVVVVVEIQVVLLALLPLATSSSALAAPALANQVENRVEVPPKLDQLPYMNRADRNQRHHGEREIALTRELRRWEAAASVVVAAVQVQSLS